MSSRHTHVSFFFVSERCCGSIWPEWTLIITLPSTKVIKSHLIKLSVTQSDTHCIFLRSGRILEFRWFQGDFNLKWQECQRRGANVRLLKLLLQVYLGTLNSLLYIRDDFFSAACLGKCPKAKKSISDFLLICSSSCMIMGGENIHERHRHFVGKSIIIKSWSELELTLYTENFQKTCPAAEGLIILTHIHTLLSLQ